ncbi:hypothetical protein M422DRAFT_253324 [Sphaerobolus stellatus SS14]|uniref:Unplaced genomic scaffold SPHSTscaffold_48, whole genome shotgun sequence n=1 Tax=Sphaerobolus stellatus (strain SS14) TaxID=990650 RepID=A0A0C9VX89_SPHS4|nr:hypothetical protein M422DRAFT_253324 [Sphaerobolus stellatus SS14]
MAPPGLARRICSKAQAEAAITSAKDDALLLTKATHSSSTTSRHQAQTKKASKFTAKSTPRSATKAATLTSKPAAKPLLKLKQTPSQHSTIPPTSMHPPAVTRDLLSAKPSASTCNSLCTRSKATVVADNDFNEIDGKQPNVDEVEDQDELSGLVESDQDDNVLKEEEKQAEEEELGAVEDGMDIDDIANVQLLKQQLAATKERINNKRKCNVNTLTPAISQAIMGDVIQAKHNVLDAHLKKKQKNIEDRPVIN